MPSACTRNRAALYGVPWLAVGVTVAAALVSGPAWAESLAVWILLGSIVLFGLPHGAADWWVMRWIAARWTESEWTATSGRRSDGALPANGARRSPSTLSTLVVGYVLATLATLAFWWWQPGWALAGFLALTAWHFGSADASVLLPDKMPLRDPVWWLFALGRGLLVIFTSLTFWPMLSAQVLMPFVALGNNTGDVISGLLRAAPALLWTGAALQTAGLCLEIRARFGRNDRRSMACEGLETGVLLLLFRVAPPLLSFACYWIAFHAWRHLLRMEPVLHPGGATQPLWRAVLDFHWRTLPLTLCSLIGLGLIFVIWPTLLHGSTHVITAYLILLSALTVPHALVVGWLDYRGGASPAA